MRVNVYSQELTNEVESGAQVSNTGRHYGYVRLMLHSSPKLHHREGDDDRSAVTLWLPSSPERREQLACTLELMARRVREMGPE